jgi:hypothetical protein
MAENFPTLVEGLEKAQRIFESIKCFDDIERQFLLGAGLSPNTYRSYLTAVKQFYEFTDGPNPLQVQPVDIERFYDHLVKRVEKKHRLSENPGLEEILLRYSKCNTLLHFPIRDNG